MRIAQNAFRDGPRFPSRWPDTVGEHVVHQYSSSEELSGRGNTAEDLSEKVLEEHAFHDAMEALGENERLLLQRV